MNEHCFNIVFNYPNSPPSYSTQFSVLVTDFWFGIVVMMANQKRLHISSFELIRQIKNR